MMRVVAVCAFVGCLLLLGPVSGMKVCAQRFPYEAPRAPEFDNQGNQVDSETSEPRRTRKKRSRRRPRAPQAPQPASFREAPRQWNAPQQQPAAATRPNPPTPQPQEPPDCSQFPGMIATAQSQNQMRWYARQYLTCLLKRGWRLAQAKQEVIRIIEAARRRGR